MSARPRRILFVIFPGAEVMDVTGPVQVFCESQRFGRGYEIQYVGNEPTARTAQGLDLAGLLPLPDDVGEDDRVIVPGYAVMTQRAPAKVVAWTRRAANAGAEMCSVCTGTFILGEAGLLDGRQCTTHWKRTAELQKRFPTAQVLGDRLFVEDGPIVSSAGIASGIDMSLALLERDDGPVVASCVAREMVVYLRRDGAHKQESVYLDYQTHLHPGIHRVQQHLVQHPESRATLAELGETAGMSERHLTRTFKRATGITLHDYRTSLRMERARDLMQNPQLTMEAIAAQCGFSDARQLRRLVRIGR